MPWGHMHRFPVAPVVALASSKRALARSAEVSYALLFDKRGLTSRSADALATAVGMHPACIWPEWWDAIEAEDKCGSVAGYKAHLRFGEPACAACLGAERDRGRRRKAAEREARLGSEAVAA